MGKCTRHQFHVAGLHGQHNRPSRKGSLTVSTYVTLARMPGSQGLEKTGRVGDLGVSVADIKKSTQRHFRKGGARRQCANEGSPLLMCWAPALGREQQEPAEPHPSEEGNHCDMMHAPTAQNGNYGPQNGNQLGQGHAWNYNNGNASASWSQQKLSAPRADAGPAEKAQWHGAVRPLRSLTLPI